MAGIELIKATNLLRAMSFTEVLVKHKASITDEDFRVHMRLPTIRGSAGSTRGARSTS